MNSFRNGFFYNCGKVFFYLLIIIIISLIFNFFKLDLKDALIDSVDAYQTTGEYPNFWYYRQGYFDSNLQFKNSTVSQFTDLNIGTAYSSTNEILPVSLLAIPTWSGNYYWLRSLYRYKANHNYTIRLFSCYTVVPNFSDVTLNSDTSYHYVNNDAYGNYSYNLNNYPYILENNNIQEFAQCDQLQFNFDAVADTDLLDLRIRYSSVKTPVWIVGFHVEDNGSSVSMVSNIYSMVSDIQNYQNSIESGINNMNSSIQNQTSSINSNAQQTNSNLNKINDSINNDNVEGANSSASAFFNDFQNDDYGLADIITMPLEYITSISSAQCQPLSFPIPFVNQNAELPCMYSIYQQYFGSFLTIYQTITTGFIAYWIFINIFAMVRGFSNPFSDKVEVLEL